MSRSVASCSTRAIAAVASIAQIGARVAQPGGTGARQLEQLVDQLVHPADLGERAVGDVLPVRGVARLAARDLEVRRDHGERRAQLVRGIGRELALRGDAGTRSGGADR